MTDFAESSVRLHPPDPVQAPDQPVKSEVASAAAVSVTTVLLVYVAEQVAPQSIPAGAEVIVPPPVPARATVRPYVTRVNVAVAALAPSMVSVQVPVPLQAPDQPVKVEVPSATAVRVTTAPPSTAAVQVEPQLTPPTLEVTVPPPVPAFAIETGNVNRAFTSRAESIVTLQPPVPVQSADHPANVAPRSAWAVSTTLVPEAKLAVHAAPQ